MHVRAFSGSNDGSATLVPLPHTGAGDWLWIDLELQTETELAEVEAVVGHLGLDTIALSDAATESDLPKLDDFDDHLVIILHGVADEHDATYEIDCFLTADTLVTIRRERSPSIAAFTRQLQRSPELSAGGPSEVLARLADVVSRRYLAILDDLDDRVEDLTDLALDAAPDYLERLTIVRERVGWIRHVLRPQREVLDQLRRTTSPLVTDGGRRRFSDVFDIAQRSVRELESARTAIADTLGAYRGAEAREATEVTRVLTIYAAVMLPLSLIAGVFGMNFVEIPGAENPNGWWIVVGSMIGVAVISLGLFAVAGWIRLPARLTPSLRRGPGDRALQAPVELAESLFKRSTGTLRPRRTAPRKKSS